MSNTFNIWDDWKKRIGGIYTQAEEGLLGQDSGSRMEEIARGSQYGRGSLQTAGGVSSSPLDPRKVGYRGSMVGRQNVNQNLQQRGLNQKILMQDPAKAGAIIAAANKNLSTKADSSAMPAHLGDKGFHNNETEQLKWWQVLANKAGIDFDKAAASWKEKGGLEGLMSNPAFTMGLAFMQAGAEGKTLGAGALDNVMKAAGISSHYKQILKDRKQEPIQATSTDIAEVKSLLKSINIDEGNIWEKAWGRHVKGEHPELEFDAAAEEIAVQLQKEMQEWQSKNLDPSGKPKIIRQTDKIDILRKLIKDKKLEKRESILSRLGITAGTIRKPVNFAQGGQIQKGQPAIVGEGGPEYFLPQESGKVLSNDDSRIFAMLLASNPQLQQVSRTRAEKILRNRFPEYFE